MARPEPTLSAVRLDKWLWAARFFKTRSLAKQAIDGGKVQLAGNRAKAAKPLHPGDVLEIQRGLDSMQVTVLQLSARRGPASIAQTLYQESPESIDARNRRQEMVRLEREAGIRTGGRPSKQDRRKIKQFRNRQGSESI